MKSTGDFEFTGFSNVMKQVFVDRMIGGDHS